MPTRNGSAPPVLQGRKAKAKELAALPEYKPLKTTLGLDEDVDASEWSTHDVANWLYSIGLGHFSQGFAEQKITGDLLHLLTEDHLKELGIKLIGDRAMLTKQIALLYRGAVQRRRFRTIWEADGLMYNKGCCDWLLKRLACYSCCNDPDHYRLTGSTLYVTERDKKRCSDAICQISKHTRAIDLSTIAGVNDFHRDHPLDCGCSADFISIDLDQEKGLPDVEPLLVTKGMGEEIAQKIRAAMEEAQSLAPGKQHMLRM